jgi:hypothetical protein
MVIRAERNTPTSSYDAQTYSGSTLDVPVFLETSGIASLNPPSTTTSIGFLTRDPIDYEGSEWNLFEYCEGGVLTFVDPLGEAKCRSKLVYPTGKDAHGRECRKGVPRSSFAGGSYVGCIEWDIDDGGISISAEINGTYGLVPNVVAITVFSS